MDFKKISLIIIFPLVIFICFIIIIASFLLNNANNSSKLSEPVAENTDTVYKEGGLEREIQRISQKNVLSNSDSATKKYLIDLLNGDSGVLSKTKNYKMDYVKSIDIIEIEILTQNIGAAKKESLGWLSKIPDSNGLGLSQAGICNFPVVFYLNFDVKISLPQDASFDPNPPGCD